MKFIASNMKKIVIGAVVAMSCGYGIAQAYSLTNPSSDGCIQCSGCGPAGGIAGVGNTLCVVCCVPPSN